MKLILSTIFLVWSFQLEYSQENVDPRILDIYSQADLDRQMKSNPNRIVYLNVKVQESYKIEEVTSEAKENVFGFLNTDDFSAELINEQKEMVYPYSDFNVFLYKIGRDQKMDKLFKLGDSGYQVRFLSSQAVMNLYNSKISKQ